MIIRNGKVHTGRGEVLISDIRIKEGKIVEIDSNMILDNEDEQVIDAQGCDILPGFIDCATHWGVNGSMTEIRNSSDDHDEKSSPITPELEAIYAVNGRAMSLQQLYAYGITTVGVMPSNNNLFGGQLCAVQTIGINPFDMVVSGNCGLKASVNADVKKTYGEKQISPMTKMGIFNMLETQFKKASKYDPEKTLGDTDESLKVLKRVVDGELPLFVTCDDMDEISKVKHIVEQYATKVVFLNGRGISDKYDWVTGDKYSIVCTLPENDMSPKTRDVRYKDLFELSKKGALIAIGASTGNFVGREDFLWSGIQMMREIQDEEAVLTMMTHNPAKILGIDSTTGTIEVGKKADLVIWSANPLTSFKAEILNTFIDGKEVYQRGDAKRCYI